MLEWWYWQYLLRFFYQSQGDAFFPPFAENMTHGPNGAGEDCVHFVPQLFTPQRDFFPFNDVPCHWEDWAIYVCEATPPRFLSALTCQAGYRPLNDFCYKLHSEIKTYDDAQQTCISEGATLIEPRSQADLHLLESEWGYYRKRWGKTQEWL